MVLGKFFKKNKSPQNGGTGEAELPTKLVTKYYLNAKSLKGKPIYELTGNQIVGSEDADILIEDKSVSNRHLEVVLDDDVVTIKDLGSESGTFLGKKQLEADKKVILRDGDVIKLGKVKLIFEEVDEEIPDLDASAEPVELATEEAPVEDASQENTPAVKAPVEEEGLSLEDNSTQPELEAESKNEDAEVETKSEESESVASAGLQISQEDLDAVEESEEPAEKTFKLQLYDYDKPDPDQIYKYDEAELDEGDKTLTRKLMNALNLKSEKKKVKVKAKKGVVTPAANAIVRFLGLIFDIVIFSILTAVLPMQKKILTYIDTYLMQAIGFIKPLFEKYAIKYVDMAYKEVPALAKIQDEIVKGYKEEYYDYILLIIFFMIFQMLVSFLFGITLGQFFFGMKAKGNFVLKRLLAPLRVFFNYLLLPFFLLFELPTVFSKRSFKEVISFTHIEMVSKARVFITLFLIIPLMGVGFIISPLFKDFTVPKPISVIANNNFKIQPVENSATNGSKAINILFEEEGAFFFPMIKTIQKEGKKIIQLGTRVVLTTPSATMSFEVLRDKEINLSKFFKEYTKLNPYVYMNYPTLLSIVNDASVDNPNFKDTKFPKDKIAQELQAMLEGAFIFDIDKLDQVQSFMIKYGPFFTGHMHLRDRILSLVEHPIKEISLKQNGQSFALFIKSEVAKNKYLYIMPINSIKTYVYKVTYATADLETKIEDILFNSKADISDYPALSFLLPYSDLKNKKEFNNDELFQKTYKAFFETSKLFVSEQNEKGLVSVQESIREMLQLLEINNQSTKLNQEIVDKMIQNLTDFLQAIIEKDQDFFGIKATKTV